jgi:hypothetical protein
MSGYCPDCGNTQCLCKEVEADQNGSAFPPVLDFATKRREEFGKRCQLCWKYRRARMFYEAIGGKYLRLCRECWEKVHKEGGGDELDTR